MRAEQVAIDLGTVHAIERLLTEWAFLLDHGRATELVDLFTPDGVFDSAGLRSAGHTSLRERFERRQGRERVSRHAWTNLRLERLSAVCIQGWAILTVFRHEGPGIGSAAPALVLDLEDRYDQIEGQWLIRERRLTRVFQDPRWT